MKFEATGLYKLQKEHRKCDRTQAGVSEVKPLQVATNNLNPDGVTESVVPSALIIYWHQLQGFFLRDATKAAKPSVASLHRLPIIFAPRRGFTL